MAYAKITFENPKTGSVKEAPIGFSWTTLFFGPLPALFRGHIGVGLAILVIAFITSCISNLVFCFIYNKMYVKHLLSQGFKMVDSSHPRKELETKLGMTIPTTKRSK
jgi:hypothetical protein